jgi:hypothetical protein
MARKRSRGGRLLVAVEVGLGAALLVGLALFYLLGWSQQESVRSALLMGLAVAGFWLVRPLLEWKATIFLRLWRWISGRWDGGAIRRLWSRSTRASPVMTLNDAQRLSPRAFEELCAAIARAWGYNAQTVGKSGDGGIDVEMWRDGEYVVAQCKRYTGTVPISQVRDFYGAMMHAGAARGYFFTTGRFSDGARTFVADKSIRLIDGDYLGRILNRLDGPPALPEADAATMPGNRSG